MLYQIAITMNLTRAENLFVRLGYDLQLNDFIWKNGEKWTVLRLSNARI